MRGLPRLPPLLTRLPSFSENRAKDSPPAIVSAFKDPMLLSDADAIAETTTIQAAAAGEHEAFAKLYHCYYPMIYAFAYRLCLNQASAHDLAQETFIKAARALSGYCSRAPFRNWLYQICANTVRDFQRTEARRRRLEADANERAAIDSEERPLKLDAVRDALTALSDDLRAAVVAVYFEGLSHAETGRILGCAETTISWRIFTAKRKLKSLLAQHE